MGKLPASLFYWGDFVRDPDVRRCTHAEVGAWIRILCLMFEAETKGVLATKGVPWTDEEIVMAIGGKYEETIKTVTSLVTKGVASRNDAGSLMNRRMYREEKERVDTRERVRKHREKQKSNAECNADGNGEDTLCTESESETEVVVLCSSTSEAKGKSNQDAKVDASMIYAAYPRKVGRGAALKSIISAHGRLTSSTGEGNYKLVSTEATSFLLAAAEEFASSPAGKAGEYCPHPATWFNQSRYLDDPQEWQRKSNGGSNGRANGKPSFEEGVAAKQEFLNNRRAGRVADATGDGGGGANGGVSGPQPGGVGRTLDLVLVHTGGDRP